MPTVLRIANFRVHFYSNEGNEPAHIHVRCADGECKFWLEPIVLASNRGITPIDLRKIEQLVLNNWFLNTKYFYKANTMTTTLFEAQPVAIKAWAEKRFIYIELTDGRIIGFPADRF